MSRHDETFQARFAASNREQAFQRAHALASDWFGGHPYALDLTSDAVVRLDGKTIHHEISITATPLTGTVPEATA